MKFYNYIKEEKNKFYYHLTPMDRINSIIKNGLILGSKETFGEILGRKDDKKYIHISKNKKHLMKLAKIEHPEIKWALLRLDLKGYKLIVNKARPRDQFFKIDKSIPPERIKIIGKNIDEI